MAEKDAMRNHAVFLDRDGEVTEVKSKRVDYVNKPDDVYLLPGAAEAIAGLREAGFKIFIVTNQGGIGLGLMRHKNLTAVHEHLKELLAEKGAFVDDIAYCPHRPEGGCSCRKPKPGMILDLARRHGIALQRSYMVGDMATDIIAGQAAGTITVLISSSESKKTGSNSTPADLTADSLLEAAVKIIRKIGRG